jgi:hypothetical protein
LKTAASRVVLMVVELVETAAVEMVVTKAAQRVDCWVCEKAAPWDR